MNPNRTKILFGPPGTGKTTRLLNEVGSYIEKGVPPDQIGFVSFTRKAADEARDRAAVRFNLIRKELPYFRTLHSMCFLMLGLDKNSVLGMEHYQEIAAACGFKVSARANRMDMEEGLWVGATKGDKVLFIENKARISEISLDEALSQTEFDDVERLELELWSRTLKSFKEAHALVDFTDMLIEWLAHGAVPTLRVLFVDEAQDLSHIQWRIVNKLCEQALDLWLAGDDDQAIFKWAGAHIEGFTKMPGEKIVLKQSYRIPKAVHKLATDIRQVIEDSVEKEYDPREEEGFVDWYGDLEQVNMDTGKWLILVRNNYLISEVEATCRKMGYWYDSIFDPPSRYTVPIILWTELCKGRALSENDIIKIAKMWGINLNLQKGKYVLADVGIFGQVRPWYEAFIKMPLDKKAYYRGVLARKEDIRGEPRIRISTIHGAKGGEEDNVVLITDMSNKTYAKLSLTPWDEHRVWYVAVTRARKSLHIVKPRTDKALPILSI